VIRFDEDGVVDMFDEKSFAFSHGFTVSDEILTAIGCAVVCQAHIESQLSKLITDLLETDSQKGSALTSGMSFKSLCASLSSLVLQVVEETDIRYIKVKELLGKLQQFEEFRNQVAHSTWGHSKDFNSDRATRIKVTARQGKGVRHQWEEVEITRISEAIKAATQALVQVVILVSALAGKPIGTLSIDDYKTEASA
jgi:hypothetical protein